MAQEDFTGKRYLLVISDAEPEHTTAVFVRFERQRFTNDVFGRMTHPTLDPNRHVEHAMLGEAVLRATRKAAGTMDARKFGLTPQVARFAQEIEHAQATAQPSPDQSATGRLKEIYELADSLGDIIKAGGTTDPELVGHIAAQLGKVAMLFADIFGDSGDNRTSN